MWHNEKLLSGIANGLFVVAALVAAYDLALLALRVPALPLAVVQVEDSLAQVSAERIESQLEGRVSGNFFGADLEGIRAALEEIPWVRRAEVRREWPDRLAVRIEEHVALARWSDGRLDRVQGELFAGDSDASLPLLGGPQGSERDVSERYRLFRELLAPLSADLREVQLTARQAWLLRARLPDRPALTLALGRDQSQSSAAERLSAFVAVYPETVGRLARSIDYVDLRYAHGFALRVPDLKWDAEPDPKRKPT